MTESVHEICEVTLTFRAETRRVVDLGTCSPRQHIFALATFVESLQSASWLPGLAM